MDKDVEKIIENLGIEYKEDPEHCEEVAEIISHLLNHGYEVDDFENMDENDIMREYKDVTDTTWIDPNDTFEGFMEHENL